MTRAAVYQELKALRPWVLGMACIALLILTGWYALLTWGWLNQVFTSSQVIPAINTFIEIFVVQLTLIALLALIPLLQLFRLGFSLQRLQQDDEVTLTQALLLNRLFWRQAEWLIWALVWLATYLMVGVMSFIFIR